MVRRRAVPWGHSIIVIHAGLDPRAAKPLLLALTAYTVSKPTYNSSTDSSGTMSGRLDTFTYYATAPLRLFGRSRKFRLALGAAFIIAIGFAAARSAGAALAASESNRPLEFSGITGPPNL